jgi:hypothetical protein
MPLRTSPRRMKFCAGLFAGLMIISALAVASSASSEKPNASGRDTNSANLSVDAARRITTGLVAQAPTPTPSYIPWYTASPPPIAGAYAAIGEAFGAGNLYNTGGTAGTGVLGTGGCEFVCFGAPGVASSNMLAMGNDFATGSFTTMGAPDDCETSATPPVCPGGIRDQVLA